MIIIQLLAQFEVSVIRIGAIICNPKLLTLFRELVTKLDARFLVRFLLVLRAVVILLELLIEE